MISLFISIEASYVRKYLYKNFVLDQEMQITKQTIEPEICCP